MVAEQDYMMAVLFFASSFGIVMVGFIYLLVDNTRLRTRLRQAKSIQGRLR